MYRTWILCCYRLVLWGEFVGLFFFLKMANTLKQRKPCGHRILISPRNFPCRSNNIDTLHFRKQMKIKYLLCSSNTIWTAASLNWRCYREDSKKVYAPSTRPAVLRMTITDYFVMFRKKTSFIEPFYSLLHLHLFFSKKPHKNQYLKHTL